MNFDSKRSEPVDDELRQILLELHYGLLDEEEAEVLQERIRQEPATATLWTETLRMAERLAQAARVSVPANERRLATRSLERARSETREVRSPSDSDAELPKSYYWRWWWTTLATAASIFATVSAVRHWQQLPSAPLADLRLSVERSIEVDNGREFLVALTPRTQPPDQSEASLDGGYDPSMPIVPATISFRVLHQG
ncbi:MAG: hypothetical protein AAGJ83_05645, partial [Planctomycetota bacterium]